MNFVRSASSAKAARTAGKHRLVIQVRLLVLPRQELIPYLLVQLVVRIGRQHLKNATLERRLQLSQWLIILRINAHDFAAFLFAQTPRSFRINDAECHASINIAQRRVAGPISKRRCPPRRDRPHQYGGDHADADPNQHVAAVQVSQYLSDPARRQRDRGNVIRAGDSFGYSTCLCPENADS